MKRFQYLFFFCSYFFNCTMVFANCDFRVEAYDDNSSRWTEYRIEISPQSSIERSFSQVKNIRNIGEHNGKVYVRGNIPSFLKPDWRWNKINAGESRILLVETRKFTCLASQEGEQNAVTETVKNIGDVVTAPSIFTPAQESFSWLQLGQAKDCPEDRPLGNQDNQLTSNENLNPLIRRGARANRNKFDNFQVTPEFEAINHYLLMQASNKTYYHQVKYGESTITSRWLPARSEREFRCAVTELYEYWGFDEVWFANTLSSANAVIARAEDKIIISVRGTQSSVDPAVNSENYYQSSGVAEFYKGTADAVVNLDNLTLVNASDFGLGAGRTHRGYAIAASDLSKLVDTALTDMETNNTPIFVTGHSLGGATATVLAQKLKNMDLPVMASYVFAPPKVGDVFFNNSIRNNLPLYVTWNYRDPVPTLISESEWFPHIQAQVLAPTFGASRKFIFYDALHQTREFNQPWNISSVESQIQALQVPPLPRVFIGFPAIIFSDEWHFHNGNFYIAFTYKQLLDSGFDTADNTGIEPEFGKSKMCLHSDFPNGEVVLDWNTNYMRFINDENGYPFQHCK